MKRKITHLFTTLTSAVALLLLASCGGKSEEDAADSASSESSVDPAITAVFLDAEPADAIPVSKARKTASPGDSITVRGKVAGAIAPFAEGFATVVISDIALETCELIPGDECRTPWDACCVDPAVIKASRLTIQVLGDEGIPVAQGLKGVRGMKELDPLVVTGTVAEGSSAENLILNVSGIFQKKG